MNVILDIQGMDQFVKVFFVTRIYYNMPPQLYNYYDKIVSYSYRDHRKNAPQKREHGISVEFRGRPSRRTVDGGILIRRPYATRRRTTIFVLHIHGIPFVNR